MKEVESPLACIIKLHAAEETLSFEIAEDYIDVEKVYGNLAVEGKTAYDLWKEYVNFNYNLGKSKKFINKFLYYKYIIRENIGTNSATVVFISKEDKKSIIYYLEMINAKWKVIKISYIEK